jgi:thiosulfate dehydrogenase [quinone] large subunit
MAIDRQGTGLTVLRIFIGVFFVFMGVGKLRWLTDTSVLTAQLSAWQHAAPAGSISARYLSGFAIPHVAVFARLVPLGEIVCGLAMTLGIWTSFFAFVAFFMALNFHVAGGTLFHYAFLTNPFGLPVLGGALALAVGGVKLPWSLR